MELEELTAYAERKYHISEQRKWGDFPGFSVLTDPASGQWIALLMRQWNAETGEEIQRCDLKCGEQARANEKAAWLNPPFRMKGEHWVGIRMTDQTDPETVFRLLDQAIDRIHSRGYLVVLEGAGPGQQPVETGKTDGGSPGRAERNRALSRIPGVFTASAIPKPQDLYSGTDTGLPEKIRQMMRMYTHRNGSFAEKCENFYRQGKFMEDYEDHEPWNGAYSRYFLTYHDLNPRQLRGYFTWRTQIRRGIFEPMTTSLAYLYVYELLNGIGADSPEDSLRKLESFERGFLDSGVGDPEMRRSLRRWMRDLAVIKQVPAETARKYLDERDRKRDAVLAVLKAPGQETDEAVFDALDFFMEEKIQKSPVIRKAGARGKRLFAELWRSLQLGEERAHPAFSACFGERKPFAWYPMANAVYRWAPQEEDRDYAMNENRVFRCRDGLWTEERYDGLYFDRTYFSGLIREADRLFRLYLKTGSPLKAREADGWVKPWAEAVIAADRQAETEAARPKITLDLSGLDRIRQDAASTRDSLLTKEETEEGSPETEQAQARPAQEPDRGSPEPAVSGAPLPDTDPPIPGMDGTLTLILRQLLAGENPEDTLRSAHLMASIAADTINEALMDAIGDTAVACGDDGRLVLAEDYVEEIRELLEKQPR